MTGTGHVSLLWDPSQSHPALRLEKQREGEMRRNREFYSRKVYEVQGQVKKKDTQGHAE